MSDRDGASRQEPVLHQKLWTVMLTTVGEEGWRIGEAGGKEARWATEDRARKRCLLSTSFMVKTKYHSEGKQHPTAVELIIKYQLLGSGLSAILCMDNKL